MRAAPHKTPFGSRSSDDTKAGFSLIELLTVMAIIGIMAAVTSSVLSGVMGSRGVAGAVNIASSLALNARMEAVKRVAGGMGGARLVVDSTPGTNDTSLRRLVVAHNVGTDSAPDWRMAGAPLSLPRGVFFSSEYSLGSGETNFDFSNKSAKQTGAGRSCVYYEFDERGRFVTPANGGDAKLIFIAGVLGADGNLTVKKDASRDGILLRRAGRVTYFQNADQITKSGSSAKSVLTEGKQGRC